jgi:ligand-binding sensor domain-containing protein
MRCATTFLFLLITVTSYPSFCQEYSFTHYDIADGLASSTVYCITQDSEGFIWVGTEAGVCRFDGTHFVTLTTADGLSDAEVLQMYGDSKGRVWMAPFKGSVCYYYQGRVHNQRNDPVLAGMGITDEVQNFAEDARGNILIQLKTALYLVRPDGGVKRYDSAGGQPISKSVGLARSRDGNFIVQIEQKVFELSDRGFSFVQAISFNYETPLYLALSGSWCVTRSDFFTTKISSLITGQTKVFPFGFPRYVHINYSITDDSLLYIDQFSGVKEYSMPGGALRRKLLAGKRVSRTFGDQAGNLWFTTLGNGIFRLNSNDFKTIQLPQNGLGVAAVHSITLNSKEDRLLVGDNHSGIYILNLNGPKPGIIAVQKRTLGISRVLFVHECGYRRLLYCTDANAVVGFIDSLDHRSVADGVKSACLIDDHRVLLGGPWGAGIFDIGLLRITDTLWRSRVTTVFNNKDTNYIGTLQGLWRIAGRKPAVFMGSQVPFLRNRVAALTESNDGTMWIASYDNSIIGYANGRVIASITSQQGLIGNICHCLYLRDRILWVGTDKGLNKIELDKPGYPIRFYTSNDGLASDIVNVVYAVGSTIFVGTSAGLSYFDESKVRTADECRLNLLAVISGGHNRISDTANLLLPVRENNIRFEFAGISYRSAGQIRYRYRLIGLDSGWRQTQDNYLDYPTLPAGRYEFQLQAVNRFGVGSDILRVPFEAATPFWNQLWFKILELAIFIAVTWLFISWRIRQVRRQQDQKAMQGRRMAELEHIALQAQMNPHFIFNCLNSIQQFVFDKDMMATNEYISSFARLIRATLNQSSRPFISVAEEMEYLSDYLSLEKMRFKNKMDFFIELGKEVEAGDLLLPPMLLQPYVENSVRHGLRHKAGGPGYIHIHFGTHGGRLVVTIRDNGIGRKKAMEYKTGEHIEYQSKGMSMTSARIQMINILYKSQIDVKVEDLQDERGQPKGTLIVINFPVFREGTRQAT